MSSQIQGNCPTPLPNSPFQKQSANWLSKNFGTPVWKFVYARWKRSSFLRLTLFFAFVFWSFCAIPQSIFADNGPHGSYTATTDACVGCHRTHTASAGRLLVNVVPSLCFTCHGSSAAGADTNVEDGVYLERDSVAEVPAEGMTSQGLKAGGFVNAIMDTDALTTTTAVLSAASSTHIADGALATLWGNGTIGSGPGLASYSLSCTSCHDPHGGGSYRILRTIPTNSGAGSPIVVSDEISKIYTVANGDNNYMGENYGPRNGQLADWCSQCHTRYLAGSGSGHTDSGDSNFRYRHTTTSVGCVQCHVAHGNTAQMGDFSGAVLWPDGSNAPNGDLRSSLLRLDNRGVCAYCHVSSDGSVGGGSCDSCHNQPQGSRRAIVPDGSGPPTQADFGKNSHHVSGNVQNSDCTVCHYMGDHMSGSINLKDPDQGTFLIYSYDPANPAGVDTFCLNCHDADGAAIDGGTTPFSDGVTVPILDQTAWFVSAHDTGGTTNSGYGCMGDGSGTGCHANGHGSDNDKILNASAGVSMDTFCYNCHTDGMVMNNAVSGSGLADDIEQAFGLSNIHDLGTSFTVSGNNFTLQCTSCHNPHVVSGKYWEADQNVSPVTLPTFTDPAGNPRAMGTALWGDNAGEKMDNAAGSGTYRTPISDTFSGPELPDYVNFCLACHGQAGGAPFGISWGNDEPHGANSANQPNGYGVCPNWYSCGKAFGWDGDECVGDEATCWPVMIRGKGDQLFSRLPYNHEERISGANFVLSCTDCHEAHGSNVSSMIRGNPNGGTGTAIWNTMCNNCHYYYSDWHAGMSCGTASCHVSNSIHRMGAKIGSSGTRTFDPDLVVHYAFSNNINDSGTWSMDGAWSDTAGSYAAGVTGNAAVFNDNHIQVGTSDSSEWANSEGDHGNTAKLVEMKYNTTIETWVYPTDDTVDGRKILSQHNFGNGGGYAMSLKKIDGTLRAAFQVNVNLGGTWDLNSPGQCGWTWSPHSDKWHWHDTWDSDCNGQRGAYSSISIPVNEWSHIAATFDTSLPDRDSNDPAVGRIRIYVNGEDVTTSDSDPTSCFAQPGPGEDTITPWSDMNQKARANGGQFISPLVQAEYPPPYAEGNPCYNSHWCGNEMFVGGFSWGTDYYVGRLDELMIWNVTKNATYFDTVDSQTAPRISSVTGMFTSDLLQVTLSEGVYTNLGGTGALTPSDFAFIDGDDGRTILSVIHAPGSNSLTIRLSAALDTVNDIGVDTLAFNSNEVYDEYDNPGGTSPVILALSGACPGGSADFQLNEPPGSSFLLDQAQTLFGEVFGIGTLTGNEYSGDGVSNYIDFENNNSCLQADDTMTLEARIRPTGLAGTANYIKRILARDAGGNYQMSVWRNNGWTNYNAPTDVASIALWVRPQDNHGGNNWKPVLTDYNACPIVSDHWYQIKAVWDTNRPGGTPGSFFVPADIYIDDQGTDGLGAGENWSGFANCTNAAQSYHEDNQKLYTDDQIMMANGDFVIGANVNDHANNVFEGLIDWIIWQPVTDYSGVAPP